ncbi:MAG: HAD family hydrolase [Blastocatellia bacterium]|nr:HAD family hydrolase [Blastocatellia bacterium]
MSLNSHNLRILLFDIDGTLLFTIHRSIYRAKVAEAVANIFGTAGKISQVSFSGKTDLHIISEALSDEGITLKEIWEALPEIEKQFVSIIETLSKTSAVFRSCPGMPGLLEKLQLDPRYQLSLLTGNIESLAKLKLNQVGLEKYFSCPGAFGSDHEDRLFLPSIAANRVANFLGIFDLSPSQFIIIGDTPRDIACAHHFGAKVLAVATGNFSKEELANAQPDLLFETLSDTDKVISALATL